MSGLNHYYASQLVTEEALDCAPREVTGELSRTPLPGTVVVHVKSGDQTVARVSFDVNGSPDVVLLNGDFGELYVAKESNCDHKSGAVSISLDKGEFPEGSQALADYEYDMF